MSLFTINRYMGEPSMQTGQKNKALAIIDKLNAKARAKERQRRSTEKQKLSVLSFSGPGSKGDSSKQTSNNDDAHVKSALQKKPRGRKELHKSSSNLGPDDVGEAEAEHSSSPSLGKKLAKGRQEDNIASTQRVDTNGEEKIEGKKRKQKRTKQHQVSEKVSDEKLRKGDSSRDSEVSTACGSPNKKIKRSVEEREITASSLPQKSRTSKLHEKDGESCQTQTEKFGNVVKKGRTSEGDVTNKVKWRRRKEDDDSIELNKELSTPSPNTLKKKPPRHRTKSSRSNDFNTHDDGEEGEAELKVVDLDAESDDNDKEQEDEMEVAAEEELAEESDKDSEEENLSFVVLGDFEKRSKKRVQETLPDWLAHPAVIERNLSDSCVSIESVQGLDVRLVSTLKVMGIVKFFPVQHHVIPMILDSLRYGIHAGEAGFRPRDLCVSAPTGSGKTLAYSIPIVQALIDRVVPRVRALVVLPTRDLATQVHKVMTSLCRNTPLKTVLIGGTKKFAQEQSLLVKEHNGEYQSLADIVVATPGRLVDNINHTPGFTLQHLRFLVIDEADRMMDQISQDWISQVEKSAYSPSTPVSHSGIVSSAVNSVRSEPGPLTVARATAFQLPLQKLLFSATLSQNPEKLTQLRLFQPRLITTVTSSRDRPSSSRGWTMGGGEDDETMMEDDGVGGDSEAGHEFVGKYTTPVGLSEYFIQCTAGEKPLVLMHLLTHLYFKQILCFTNTVQATHRLFLLLRLMGGVEVAEFSSNLQQSQRQAIVKHFMAGKIQILVCSDAMARGMDIDNVKCVISYDLPPHLKTYIHRVGRTARAGRAGTAFSLIRKKEVTKFKQMLRNAGKDRIQRHHVSPGQLDSLVPSYTEALSQLPSLLKEEKAHQY